MSAFSYPYTAIHAELAALSRPVRLIAVSKHQPIAAIRALYAAGCRDFGENYVQEWIEKRRALATDCPEIRWHLIGTLQSNKLGKIAGAAHTIHSLYRRDHAEKLNALAASRGIRQAVLVEINVAQEASKGGIRPEACLAFLKTLSNLPHLAVTGLMTFPPETDAPETSRPAFRALAALLREGQRVLDPAKFCELSMGTSRDWRVALSEGATMIRLGTTIFGSRA